MIINHNISALNTHRQLGANNNAVQNSLEKLSSGLGINKAGDDAAGLAISEKMRGQIRGLEQAQNNAQDGISLIQTAEGALSETQDILQRMRELSVQSSNDTNTDKDREALQDEMNQLAEEITRISDNTEFNTKNLLGKDGNAGFEGKFHIGANANQSISLEINNMSASNLKVSTEYEVGADGKIADLDYKGAVEAKEYTATADGTIEGLTHKQAADEVKDGEGNVTTPAVEAGYYAGDTLVIKGDKLTEGDTHTVAATEAGYYNAEGKLVIAAEEELTEGEVVTSGINISSQEDADKAITTINSAIETVSAERSKLGAVQNRLDHTINNLGASAENLTAAESRIRDVDMAKEMMEFTKNNILSQAAQAMLAQANQQPQGVLQLLR